MALVESSRLDLQGRLASMSFDRLAPFYRGMEWALAGPLLHRCRTAFLPQATQSSAALLLGEGPGRYLLELLRANSQVRVTCLDSSDRMLDIARRRAQSAGFSKRRVQFVCADWADWTGQGNPFDLIATHFFLDCFTEEQLAPLVGKIAALSSPDAAWVLSDFRLPDHGWRRLRAGLVLKLAYAFFRLTTGLSASRIVPPAPFLAAAGFQREERRLLNHGLLHAELWTRSTGPP